MTSINRLAQALGYVKLAKQSLEPTAEFYEAYALEKLNEVESALITGITDMSTQATPHETLQAEIQSLKERVTALEQIEKKRMYDEAYNDYLNGDLDEIIESSVKEARQLTRDDIIEMAKRDVAELGRSSSMTPTRILYSMKVGEYNGFSFSRKCYAEFIVNREKRTVVALLRGYNTDRVVSRGIAKCHPDDCFNAHIGRAIALRRALGLEVPDEYLNAPQPTEVMVGDIVESRLLREPERYTVVRTDEEVDEKPNRCHIESLIVKNFPVKTKIIDDSRE
jgi:hypothetical protein